MRSLVRPAVVVLVACVAAVAQAQNVLVFDGYTTDHVAQQACSGAGFTCTVADPSNFTSLLTGGSWDLVVMDYPSNAPSGDWQTPLLAYVAGGGRAIMTGWDATALAPITSAFGVSLGSEHEPLTLYRWNSSTLFTMPNTVPDPLAPVDNLWGSNGYYLTSTGTTTEAGGFTSSVTAGQAAIVVANGGRTIFNGFLFDDYSPADANSDGKDDAVELVQNEMAAALLAGVEPIPTLGGAGLVVLALLLAGIGAAVVAGRRLAG